VAFVSVRAVLRRELGASCGHFIAAYSWANANQLICRSARSIRVVKAVNSSFSTTRRIPPGVNLDDSPQADPR